MVRLLYLPIEESLVEKPPVDKAPSNLAVIGRYILSPEVLVNLDKATQGAGGEIQLTDAIAQEIGTRGVYGFRFRGQRYDCGSKAGFLQATVAFGCSHILQQLTDAFLVHRVSRPKLNRGGLLQHRDFYSKLKEAEALDLDAAIAEIVFVAAQRGLWKEMIQVTVVPLKEVSSFRRASAQS